MASHRFRRLLFLTASLAFLSLVILLVPRLRNAPEEGESSDGGGAEAATDDAGVAAAPLVVAAVSGDDRDHSLPPVAGSALGSDENADWVAGRIGSFFVEATVLDAQRFQVDERVEDRKTLLETSGVDPRRVLIEERLIREPDGSLRLLSSHGSVAEDVVVGLAPVSGGRSAGLSEQTAAMALVATEADEAGFAAYRKSDLSPVVVSLGSADSIAVVLAGREAVQSLDGIRYVEPNYIYTTQAQPNDPSFADGSLWGMNNTGQNGGIADVDINAPEAWETRTGAPGVVVAVVDTGVFYDHEDLKDNMWTNPGEVAGNGIDDDGNGYVDDVYGINTITSSGDPLDDHSHGTHCAGTIGGRGDNGVGVAGVAWDVQIMACKFLSADGWGTLDDAVTAINYAAAMGADITSNSWGGGGFSQTLLEAFQSIEEAGGINVAAAGNALNDNDLIPSYPSSYDIPSMVAVSAVDRAGQLAWFSSYGRNSVDIAAPGVDVLSCVNEESGYELYSGTSMACPHVSGALAILYAHYPDEDSYRLINRLVSGAKPLDSVADKVVAAGMLDLAKSLNTPSFPFKPVFTRRLSDVDYIVGEAIELSADVIGDAPLSYQWYRDGEPIAGATSPDFRIEETSVEDQGLYTIEVSNPAGRRVSSVPAVAYSPTTEPLAASVSNNEMRWAVQVIDESKKWYLQDEWLPSWGSTRFALQAGRIADGEKTGLLAMLEGPTTLSFVWRADCDPSGKDGLNLYLDGVKIRGIKPYQYQATGWSSQSVDIPEGEHRVLFAYEKDGFLLAGNDTGWIGELNLERSESSDGDLEVDEDGVKIGQRVDRKAVEGQRVLLRLDYYVYRGDVVSWKKGDVDFENLSNALYLPSPTVADSGRYEMFYRVTVWDGEQYVNEERKAIFDLEVVTRSEAMTPPRIVSQPDTVQSKGAQALVRVVAESLLPMTYQWSFNGEAIPGATFPSLELLDFTPEQEGDYVLTISNDAGSVDTNPIFVQHASETAGNVMIVAQPTVVVADQGETAVISVSVRGTEPISYRWYRENAPLDGQVTDSLRLGNASSVLHNGSYVLEATNAYGSVRSWPIQLSITSPNGLAEAVDRVGEKWYSVGNTSWILDTKISVDQEDSAFFLGTNLGIGEKSRLETELLGPATIEFFWNTQGGQYFDVRLLVDGVSTGVSKFGSTGWDRESYRISSAGLHTVAWEFESRSSTFWGVPQSHMLAWVDQVKITRPEPQHYLPNETRFTVGIDLVQPLEARGYLGVEVDGMPEWLHFNERTLSLEGLPTDTRSHWLRVRMKRPEGGEDHAWIKLVSHQSGQSDQWEAISGQPSGEGAPVGHFELDSRLFLVSANGFIRFSEDGVEWETSVIPFREVYETISSVERIGDWVYAFGNLSIYRSEDGQRWKWIGSAYNEPPAFGGIVENGGAYYGLNYSGLVYSEDLLAWSLILPNESFSVSRLFQLGDTIYGLDWAGEQLLRYVAEENRWTMARSFAERNFPVERDGQLYWIEKQIGGGYRLVRSAAPEGESVETVADLDRAYQGIGISASRVMLWGYDGYAQFEIEDSVSISEVESTAFWDLIDVRAAAAVVGDLAMVYLGNVVTEARNGSVSEDAREGLSSFQGVATSGGRALFYGGGSTLLLSDDGVAFEKVEIGRGLSRILPKGDGFIGNSGAELFESADGRSWTSLATLPDLNDAYPNMEYANGVYVVSVYQDDRNRTLVSQNGEQWVELPSDEPYLSWDSYGAFNGNLLRVTYSYESSGYELQSSSDGQEWETLHSEPDYMRLLVSSDRSDVYLVGYNVYLRSSDLQDWERVDKLNETLPTYAANGWFYSFSASQVTLFDENLDRTYTLLLPISASYVAIGPEAVYACHYGGDAVRVDIPSEANRAMGPSNQRPGPTRDDRHFYAGVSSIPENAPIGHNLGIIGIANSSLEGSIGFSLIAGEGDKDNARFEILGGELRALETFDYEADPQLSLRLRAESSEGEIEGILLIDVENVNEAPTDLRLTNQLIAESVPEGTQLGAFYVVDPDENEAFSFKLISGVGDDHNSEFDLVNNGIVARSPFDLNAQSVYYLRARATDSSGLAIERRFTLTIIPDEEMVTRAFDLWIREALGDETAGVSLLYDDLDGDGMANLVEYYLNTNPNGPDSTRLLEARWDPEDAGVELVLHARANNPSLAWEWQTATTDDLTAWESIPISFDSGRWALEKGAGQIVEAVNVEVGLWRLRIKLPKVEQKAFFRLVIDYAE